MEQRFADLARLLEALASPTRLELLHQLRTPRAVGEIRVLPSLSREGERPERPLTRQAVAHHLEQLGALGLVQKLEEGYVIDHAQLFALVDEVRSLAKLRPILPTAADAALTMPREGHARANLPAPPRLLVTYGREDGVAFPLHGPPGATWRVGRGVECEVRLDYDPFASSVNTIVERTERGFVARDAGSRNGTWVDWERLPRGRDAPLAPGAALTVGRSVLVLQAGP